jgi:hypothetical protein
MGALIYTYILGHIFIPDNFLLYNAIEQFRVRLGADVDGFWHTLEI